MKNILVTSVGRRVVLVKICRETLCQYDKNAKIYTTDMIPQFAPAGIISDRCFKVPKVTDDDYVPYLLDICENNNIGLVIPTIDTELLVLSENKTLFSSKGIIISVADSFFIKQCRDKRKTSDYLTSIGIKVPKQIDINHPTFPMFAKPYDGSSSKDLYVIKNLSGLTPEIQNHPKLIFMEYVDKKEYKEFTVDMYYGKDGHVKAIIPRERVEIRAGETTKGYTRKNYIVDFLRCKMEYLPGVIGCLCFQLFFRERDHDIIGIEMNPRFGGGYPLSYYAKANFIDLLIREYFMNEDIEYSDDWLDNTLILRYDSDIIIHENYCF